MNRWLHLFLWLSVVTLFGGIAFSKALTSIGVGFMGMASLLVLYKKEGFSEAKSFNPILSFGLFMFFVLLSVGYSESIVEGLDQWWRLHPFLTIPLMFLVLSKWLRSRLTRLLDLFVGACALHALFTIILFAMPESTVAGISEQIEWMQPYPDLTDRLKFGLYTPFLERLNLAYLFSFALLYLLYQVVVQKAQWYHWLSSGIIALAFVLIGARGAQLALLIAIGIGAGSFWLEHIKSLGLERDVYLQRIASALTLILVGIIAVPYVTYKTIPAVQKRYDQMKWELQLIENGGYLNEEYQYFTSLTRIRAMHNAIDIIKAQPMLGTGIGDYDQVMQATNAKYNDKVPAHNQNFFLYIWGAAGLVALALLLFAFQFYLMSFWKGVKRPIRHLVLSYVIFIVVSSMIDAFLKYQIGNTSVPLFLSAMFLLNISDRSTEA